MNELTEGIKIISRQQNRGVALQYWINSGTTAATAYPEPLYNYDKSARVPKQDWRPPTKEEMRRLVTSADSLQDGLWISVLSMPQEILAPFQKLYELSQGKDVEPLRQMAVSENIRSAVNDILPLLKALHRQPENKIQGGDIFVGFPQKLTLTFAQGPRYIGLHIDSFYPCPIENRASSPNRICINLGAGDRYLYFINLPVIELKRTLDAAGSEDPRRFQIGSQLGTAFMERFPAYPVVKVKIAPGEAYIAPTENMIHEGSSLGNQNFDTHLTFRSYFRASW